MFIFLINKSLLSIINYDQPLLAIISQKIKHYEPLLIKIIHYQSLLPSDNSTVCYGQWIIRNMLVNPEGRL